ncbi:MAG: hypothetical protein HFF50_04075 [Lawsonibacter sp.]|nr:hypothetical protein [Lawsonibacter sp.]
MGKSFRFFLQFCMVNLGAILAFATVVFLGCCATGVPQGAEGLFSTYFHMFPMMSLIMVFVYGWSLCTTYLNLGLSLGARRQDMFRGVLGAVLLSAGVCWLLLLVMSSIPELLHWPRTGRISMLLDMGSAPGSAAFYLAAAITLQCLGALCGLVLARSKVWGTLLMIAALLLFVAISVFLMLSILFDWSLFLFVPRWLPWAVLALVSGVSVWGIRRTIFRYVVR